MGILAHPQGLGCAPSEVDKMTMSEIKFWIERMNKINKAASNG